MDINFFSIQVDPPYSLFSRRLKRHLGLIVLVDFMQPNILVVVPLAICFDPLVIPFVSVLVFVAHVDIRRLISDVHEAAIPCLKLGAAFSTLIRRYMEDYMSMIRVTDQDQELYQVLFLRIQSGIAGPL